VNCPSCEHHYTKVKETRVIEEQPRWSKRRRVCPECDHMFWTIEMPAEDVNIEAPEEQ
jgi:transcriptional regulator NrdR family protein